MADAAQLIDELKTELDKLKNRLVIDDDVMKHLHEIYYQAFAAWYDPDNEEHRKWGQKIWPHISAINDKVGFKR
jgi:hypothetical protein